MRHTLWLKHCVFSRYYNCPEAEYTIGVVALSYMQATDMYFYCRVPIRQVRSADLHVTNTTYTIGKIMQRRK